MFCAATDEELFHKREKKKGKMHDARLEVKAAACLRGANNLATTNLFKTTIYSWLVDAN